MRSIPYSRIERGIAAIAGIDPNNLLSHEKVMISEYVNDATKYVWDYYPWPESTITEIRYFRPEWDEGGEYVVGDEVFYKGRYWRKWGEDTETERQWQEQQENYEEQNGRWSEGKNPRDEFLWHEIGDFDVNEEWREDGVYYVGAKIAYEGKTYLCIKQLNGTTSSRLTGVNYVSDEITPLNGTYFMEIDTKFERVIDYEQAGMNVIGTMISAHTEDPRYEETEPLNWVEGAEGIYVQTPETVNFIWMRYRKEAPEYSENTPDNPVLNFLAPAIKAYAYRSFLVADGQHEKAQLQDLQALDLLVREVDKLNHQQDRGQAGTIYSEPYRRITVKGNVYTEPTDEKIATIYHRGVDVDIAFDLKKKVEFEIFTLKTGTSTSEFKFFTIYANIEGQIEGKQYDAVFRNASASISFGAGSSSFLIHNKNVSTGLTFEMVVGTATWTSDLLWENADVLWDSPDQQDTFTAQVHSRNASSSFGFNLSAGSAGYESSLRWEDADVDWGNAGGTLHEGLTNSQINFSTNQITFTKSQLLWDADTSQWQTKNINWEG
jgi:hypothetical protein